MREISLTRGYVALVDDADFNLVNSMKWYAHSHAGRWIYARHDERRDERTKWTFLMHRFILGIADPDILIDHKDGNGLNNQRHNLRVCNRSLNQGNRRTHKAGVSRFKGVNKTRNGTWTATVQKKYLGTFATEEQAAHAYNAKAIIIFGEFALLNEVW